jgi:hypothetical protein
LVFPFIGRFWFGFGFGFGFDFGLVLVLVLTLVLPPGLSGEPSDLGTGG